MIIFPIMITLLSIVILVSAYMLFRNRAVYKKQIELIEIASKHARIDIENNNDDWRRWHDWGAEEEYNDWMWQIFTSPTTLLRRSRVFREAEKVGDKGIKK